jgi:hypothetical protein
MIRVIDVFIAIKPCFRIPHRNGVRLVLSDEAGEILPQCHGRLQFSVRIPHKNCLFDSQYFIRGELFLLAQLSQFLLITSIFGGVVRT